MARTSKPVLPEWAAFAEAFRGALEETWEVWSGVDADADLRRRLNDFELGCYTADRPPLRYPTSEWYRYLRNG